MCGSAATPSSIRCAPVSRRCRLGWRSTVSAPAAIAALGPKGRLWDHSCLFHNECRTAAFVRSGHPALVRPASQNGRTSAVARNRCPRLVRAVIRGNEGAAHTCGGDQAGEARRFGGIVAGRLPTQSYMHCAIFLLYICLSADKITHIWRDDSLVGRSRMHECQGFEPL